MLQWSIPALIVIISIDKNIRLKYTVFEVRIMEFSTEHHRIYDDFIKDLRFDERIPAIKYPKEYNGQDIIKLVVSQHGYLISEKKQKQITESWIRFLSEYKLPLKKVQICSNVNQRVFDAICNQDSIETLIIKCFKGNELNQIVNLKNLKELYFERASSLESIESISELENLEKLILCHTHKVYDYSCLKKLKNLKVLGITTARTSYDGKLIKAKSIDFIKEMNSLEYVDIQDVKVMG